MALATLVLALAGSACVVRYVQVRRVTGTCEGACAHYLDCKGSRAAPGAEVACVTECRGIFEDAESLRAFESLSCDKAIEFVDGEPAVSKAVTESRPPS